MKRDQDDMTLQERYETYSVDDFLKYVKKHYTKEELAEEILHDFDAFYTSQQIIEEITCCANCEYKLVKCDGNVDEQDKIHGIGMCDKYKMKILRHIKGPYKILTR